MDARRRTTTWHLEVAVIVVVVLVVVALAYSAVQGGSGAATDEPVSVDEAAIEDVVDVVAAVDRALSAQVPVEVEAEQTPPAEPPATEPSTPEPLGGEQLLAEPLNIEWALAELAADEQRSVSSSTMEVWATSVPGGVRVIAEDSGVTASAATAPVATVRLDTSSVGQRWQGIGASLTDASVALLDGRPAAIEALFGSPAEGGAGLDLVRLPLSATDFSMSDWTWEAVDGAVEPPPEALTALEVLDQIGEVAPVGVYAVGWTAPGGLRSAPEARGGVLLDEAVADYGGVLLGQVEELLDRGVPLQAVSLGNEPGHVSDYPTLGMTDEQMLALADIVAGPLDEVGVDLVALEHNWSDVGRAERLMADGPFDAAAFHCYGGDPAVMAQVGNPIVTECTATIGQWPDSVGWMVRELVAESVRAGATGVFTWNLALDPQHGPKAPGGCENCRGLLTIDPEAGTVEPTPEYSVMRLLATAADPGAVVLATERIEHLPVVAFANPDGSVGVFGHNDTDAAVTIDVVIDGADSRRFTVEPWAVFSVRG